MDLYKFFKDNNFVFWVISGHLDREFLCVGKKGRFYGNYYTAYRIRLLKEDGQLTDKITYESVEKSFNRKMDAVKYCLDNIGKDASPKRSVMDFMLD
jgi:hypothetical protein